MVIEFVLCIRVAGSLPYACGFVRTTCGSDLLRSPPSTGGRHRSHRRATRTPFRLWLGQPLPSKRTVPSLAR